MPTPKITDEDLLERLTRVFQDHGFEGASLSLISKATGLERASLYHRFPDGKDQMAEAVVAHVGEQFLEKLLAPLREPGPVAARIREAGRRLQAFYEDGRRSCLLDTLSLGNGRPALHAAVGRTYAAWRDSFAAAAREAGLAPALSRRRAEEAIMSIHGALVLARATGDTKPFARVVGRLPEVLTVGRR
ncbi:MAG TPA: TetR/AcrR family transcriptional regulator [Bryobacteraceae bacterium]|nr:TetR/AcrR family transcriptional regulator [Bryobacteraceae bacterium]